MAYLTADFVFNHMVTSDYIVKSKITAKDTENCSPDTSAICDNAGTFIEGIAHLAEFTGNSTLQVL
jgi:hypothetical protein